MACISSTAFLNKYLRRVCIDNEYSKTILKKKKVTHWPVFVILDNSQTTIYELHDANLVFQKVYEKYLFFYPNAQHSKCPNI